MARVEGPLIDGPVEAHSMAISGHQRQSVVINALIGGTLIDGPVEAFEGAEQPAALRIDEQQGRLGAREQQLWGNRGGRGAVVSSSRVGSALVSSSCARPSIRSHSDLIRISFGSHSDLIKDSSRAHQWQSRAITCAMAASVSNRTEGNQWQSSSISGNQGQLPAPWQPQ